MGYLMIHFGNILFQPWHTAPNFDIIQNTALECERLDFDSIWLYDHVLPGKWYDQEASLKELVFQPVLEVLDHAVSFEQNSKSPKTWYTCSLQLISVSLVAG